MFVAVSPRTTCTSTETETALFFFSASRERRAGQAQVQPEEAQAQPKAQDALHDQSVAGPREEVPGETVLERRREGGVLVVAEPHGDTGKHHGELPGRSYSGRARTNPPNANSSRALARPIILNERCYLYPCDTPAIFHRILPMDINIHEIDYERGERRWPAYYTN